MGGFGSETCRRESSSPAEPAVLFVAGYGRSGSTLLEALLSRTARYTAVGELCYVWSHGAARNWRCSCGLPFDECPFWAEVRRNDPDLFNEVTVAEMIRSLEAGLSGRNLARIVLRHGRNSRESTNDQWIAQMLSRLYVAVSAAADGTMIVDSSKHPAYLQRLLEIHSLDLAVAQIVRDPRATAWSWSRTRPEPAGSAGEQMHRYSTTRAAIQWVLWNSSLVRVLAHGKVRSTLIRYEDLVADPNGTVRDLADARKHGCPEETRFGLSHSVSGNPMRFQTGPIAVMPDMEYREKLSTARWSLITAVTFATARRFGYRVRRG